jgi:predicted dehydrogenase
LVNLRAGVVGTGVMGLNHLRVLKNLNGVEFAGAADTKVEALNQNSTSGILGSLEELLALELDYCVVATPTASHLEIAKFLMSHGVAVLVEKPIADSLSNAQEMVNISKATGMFAGVGHIERFNSAARFAKDAMREGRVGEIIQIATRRQGPFPGRITDVGVIKDLATHDIDLTRWISESEYEDVSAVVARKSGREYEDLVASTGILKNGIVVNHLVNWLSPLKEREVIVTGTSGTIRIDTLSSEVTIFENGSISVTRSELAHFKGVTQGNIFKPAFDKPEPLKVEHENFRDGLLGLSNDVVTLESGMKTLEVAEKMIESAKVGR